MKRKYPITQPYDFNKRYSRNIGACSVDWILHSNTAYTNVCDD